MPHTQRAIGQKPLRKTASLRGLQEGACLCGASSPRRFSGLDDDAVQLLLEDAMNLLQLVKDLDVALKTTKCAAPALEVANQELGIFGSTLTARHSGPEAAQRLIEITTPTRTKQQPAP